MTYCDDIKKSIIFCSHSVLMDIFSLDLLTIYGQRENRGLEAKQTRI